ncbi:MAG TPA: alkaline phosphatase family protein [Candidatus Lokiarchaeia archaeon]
MILRSSYYWCFKINRVNRIVLCIIDDVRADSLFDLINQNKLPNINFLKQNGIFSKNCITDFPSITYPTHMGILTGTYTGDYKRELCHGVPLGDWMGRDTAPPHIRSYASRGFQIYKINNDLGENCKTIFEMVDEGNRTSIAQFINRGANYIFPENKWKLVYYYFLTNYYRNQMKKIHKANSVMVQKLIDNFKNPKKYFGNNEPPVCAHIWFMTSDILMHTFGYDHEIYKLNLINVDKLLGILIKKLKKMGYLEDTAIAITSDHGNYKAKKVGNLGNFFERNGLIHYHPKKYVKGNFNLSEFAGVGFFNFKGIKNASKKHQWNRPTIEELSNFGPKRVNLFETLFKIEDSQLMYYRDDNNTTTKGIIHLKRKNLKTGKVGNGRIEYEGSGINLKTKYIVDNEEDDIFEFTKDNTVNKLLNNKFHTIEEWTNATNHLNYPIYPDLVVRHFKNPRSSDIIISTSGEVVYNYQQGKKEKKNEFVYTHDLGLRDSMIVPLIVGGSKEIPHKEINYCKITDIVPTLLNTLGKKPHKSVIGKSLI